MMSSVVAVVENYKPIKFFNHVQDARKWLLKHRKSGRAYNITIFEVL